MGSTVSSITVSVLKIVCLSSSFRGRTAVGLGETMRTRGQRVPDGVENGDQTRTFNVEVTYFECPSNRRSEGGGVGESRWTGRVGVHPRFEPVGLSGEGPSLSSSLPCRRDSVLRKAIPHRRSFRTLFLWSGPRETNGRAECLYWSGRNRPTYFRVGESGRELGEGKVGVRRTGQGRGMPKGPHGVVGA